MIESVHCPNCHTHYALRPARVHHRHRRALCFNCDQTFSIQEEVRRLFPGEELLGSVDDAVITSQYPTFPSDELTTQSTGPLPVEFPETEETPRFLPEPMQAEPAAHFTTPEAPPAAPETHYPLTLGDLEEPDSAMERTLILNPAGHPELRGMPSHPAHSAAELEALGLGPGEPPARTAAAEAAEPEEGISTYSSARDAIDKLLSGTPAPQRVRPMSMGRPGTPMDLESTLDALEETLGGTPASRAMAGADAPGSTVMLSHRELDQAMISQTAEPEPSASTQLLNLADLQMTPPPPMEATLRMPRPVLEPPPPPIRPVSSPALETASTIPVVAPPPLQPAAVQDPNLLKVQLEQDTLSNVGMDQLIQMVEQGRVKEYHLVARQFSENWLEASKVPALRPVFERMRRLTQMGPAPTLGGGETAPVKKSLFGGLFGGKN